MSFRAAACTAGSIICCFFVTAINHSTAQENCVGYMLIQKTIYDQTPVKVTQQVNETVYQTKQITEYKPVWHTEKRERRTTVMKPVRNTSDKIERYRVRWPITETKYRERQYEETTYETVTEYQDQEVIVERPVYETQTREESVVVKKPVTEKLIRHDTTTVYRPVVVEGPQLTTANLNVDQLIPVGGARPRMQWLTRGYYLDPVTGQSVFRRGGFYWVPKPTSYQLQSTNVPVLALEQSKQVSLVPQSVETQTPVDVTRFVETVETRKVPVRVEKTLRQVETRKVPVQVKKPKIVVRTERVPYQETRYIEQIIEQRVPVTETTYKQVERVEPYELNVARWVPFTREIEVPTVVPKTVEVELIKHTPRTVTMRVPVDVFGNIVGPAVALDGQSVVSTVNTAQPTVQSAPATDLDETSSRQLYSIVEQKEPASNEDALGVYHARPVPAQTSETAERMLKPATQLGPVRMPSEPVFIEPTAGDPTLSSSTGGTDQDSTTVQKPTRSADDVELDAAQMAPTLKSPPPSIDPAINGPGSNENADDNSEN